MEEREKEESGESGGSGLSPGGSFRVMPGGTLGLLLVLCARVVLVAIKDQWMVLG